MNWIYIPDSRYMFIKILNGGYNSLELCSEDETDDSKSLQQLRIKKCFPRLLLSSSSLLLQIIIIIIIELGIIIIIIIIIIIVIIIITSTKEVGRRLCFLPCLFVCLFVNNFLTTILAVE